MSSRKSVRITIDLPPLEPFLASLASSWTSGWKKAWENLGNDLHWRHESDEDGDSWHGSDVDEDHDSAHHRSAHHHSSTFHFDSSPHRDGEHFREEREFTLAVVDNSLTVDCARKGSLRITGSDRDTIQVRAEVEAWGVTTSEAEALAEQIEIETDRRLVARGPKTTRDSGWAVNYEIQVPHDIDLDLKVRNGAISLIEVRGKTRINGSNGAIALTGVGGDVRGRTLNGAITIGLTGKTWEGRGLDLETLNGSITMQIPEGYDAELETATMNGRTILDFPLEVQGRLGRRLRTTLGDGGPSLRAKTTNGRIRLERP